MADIGEAQRRVKVVPLTQPSVPQPNEPEPQKAPVKEPEKVDEDA